MFLEFIPSVCQVDNIPITRYGLHFISWFSYTSRNSNLACIVPFFRSSLNMSSSRFSASYASLSRPPVGTTLYDRVYNDDLAYIKVQIMNMLNGDRLPNMPMGFPFRIVDDRCGGSPVSRGPYEFQEHFCPSDHRGRTQSVTFSYSPSEEREELSWRITVPSRESSLNKNIPCMLWALVTCMSGRLTLPAI